MLVAVVGVAVGLALSIRERQRESTTLRALGLTRGQVVTAIGMESGLLGVAGVLVGTLLGIGFGALAVYALRERAVVPLDLVLLGAGTLVLVAIVAGALPALRAAWRSPLPAPSTEKKSATTGRSRDPSFVVMLCAPRCTPDPEEPVVKYMLLIYGVPMSAAPSPERDADAGRVRQLRQGDRRGRGVPVRRRAAVRRDRHDRAGHLQWRAAGHRRPVRRDPRGAGRLLHPRRTGSGRGHRLGGPLPGAPSTAPGSRSRPIQEFDLP